MRNTPTDEELLANPGLQDVRLGPWIQHNHHRFTRMWRLRDCGGPRGPAAVISWPNHSISYEKYRLPGGPVAWSAFGSLCGHDSGTADSVQEAMLAVDALLAEDCKNRPESEKELAEYPPL